MRPAHHMRVLLPVLFASALVLLVLNMNYGPPLKGESVSQPPGVAWQEGSPFFHPEVAALAESRFGVIGARLISILFGAGLSVVIYLLAKDLFSPKYGLPAALVFFTSGVSIHVAELATAEIQAAFFLGLCLLFIELSGRRQAGAYLFIAALCLTVAVLTKYTAALFVVPVSAWALWRRGYLKSGLYFVLPVSIMLSAYGVFLLPPDYLKKVFLAFPSGVFSPAEKLLAGRMFRLVGIPCMLSIFGLSDENFRQKVLFLVLASVPAGIFYILSGDIYLDRDCVFPLVFLAPAVSVGIEELAGLFSSNTPLASVKFFFLAAMLIVISVFGLHEFRWLRTQ